MRSLRVTLILGALTLLGGCATRLPMGARPGPFDQPFRRFNPPAPARPVPGTQPKQAIGAGPSSTRSAASAAAEVTRVPPAIDPRKALSIARSLVGKKQLQVDGQRFPNDCTGLIAAAYASSGLELLSSARATDNGVTAMYRFAQRHGRVYETGKPTPGDLVFFRETYDQNRDGRANDGLTHVGIVDEVEPDGTVTVIHRVSRGVVRYRMNLTHRTSRRDPRTGRAINDYLRAPGSGQKSVLTGQLFAAYGSLVPPDSTRGKKPPSEPGAEPGPAQRDQVARR